MWRANARQAGEFEIFLSRRRGERGEGEQKQRNGLHTAGNGNRASLSLSLSLCRREAAKKQSDITMRHHASVRPSVRPSVRRTLIQQSRWWVVISDMRARGRGRTATSP